MSAVILSPQPVANCNYKAGVIRTTLCKRGYDFVARAHFSSDIFNRMIRNAFVEDNILFIRLSGCIDRISVAKLFNEANLLIFLSFPMAQ